MRQSISSSRDVERRRHVGRRVGAVVVRGGGEHRPLQLEGDLPEDLLLGVEVAVERPVRRAGALHDVGHVGVEVALLGEHLGRRPARAGPACAVRAACSGCRPSAHRPPGSVDLPPGSVIGGHVAGRARRRCVRPAVIRPWRCRVHEIGLLAQPARQLDAAVVGDRPSCRRRCRRRGRRRARRRRRGPGGAAARPRCAPIRAARRGVVLDDVGQLAAPAPTPSPARRRRRRRPAASATSSAGVSGADAHDDAATPGGSAARSDSLRSPLRSRARRRTARPTTAGTTRRRRPPSPVRPTERDEAQDVVRTRRSWRPGRRTSASTRRTAGAARWPRGVAVDVGVADLDAVEPAVDLPLVEAVQAAGQAVGDAVLQLDGVVQVVGPHHAEHRPEALGLVEPRPGPHAEAHAGCPQPAGVVERPRARRATTRRGRARASARAQRARRRGDQRADHRGQVGRRADAQAAHGVGEPVAERRRRRTAAPRRWPGWPPSTSARRARTPSGRGRAAPGRRRRSG